MLQLVPRARHHLQAGDEAVVEVILDEHACCLQADDAFLSTIGYEPHELRGVPISQIAEIARADGSPGWQELLNHGADVKASPAVTLRRRDGTGVPGRLEAVIPGETPATRRVRLAVLSEPRTASSKPALHRILAEWRSAERDLAGVDDGDHRHEGLVDRVAELRTRYQEQSRPKGHETGGA